MKQFIYPAIIFFIIFSSFAEGDNVLVTKLSYYNITDDDFIKSFEIPIINNTIILSNKKTFNALREFLEKHRLEAARIEKNKVTLYGYSEERDELIFTQNDLVNIFYSSLKSISPYPSQTLQPIYNSNELRFMHTFSSNINSLKIFRLNQIQDMIESDIVDFRGSLADTNVGYTFLELDKILKTSDYVDELDYYLTKTFYESWINSNFSSHLLYELLFSKENSIIFNFNLKGMAHLKQNNNSDLISFTNLGLNLELQYKKSSRTPFINRIASKALELFRSNVEIKNNIYATPLMLQCQKYANLFILLQILESKGVVEYNLPLGLAEHVKDKKTPLEIYIRDKKHTNRRLIAFKAKCKKLLLENEKEIKIELLKPVFHLLYDVAIKYYGLSNYSISQLSNEDLVEYMLNDNFKKFTSYESKEEVLNAWLDGNSYKVLNYLLANGNYLADRQLEFNSFWNSHLKKSVEYNIDKLILDPLNFELMENLKSGGITLDITPILSSNSLLPTMIKAIKENKNLTDYPLILKELESIELFEDNVEQLEEIANLFLPPINTELYSFDKIMENEWIQLTKLGLNRNRNIDHLFTEINDIYIVTDIPDLQDIVKTSPQMKPFELMTAENLHSLLLSLDSKKWINLTKEKSPRQLIKELSQKARQEKKHIFLFCHQFGKKLHFTKGETLPVGELGDNITPIACNTHISSEKLQLITTDEINLIDALTAIEIIYQMGGDKKPYVLYDYYNALIKRNKKFRGICTRYIETLKNLN